MGKRERKERSKPLLTEAQYRAALAVSFIIMVVIVFSTFARVVDHGQKMMNNLQKPVQERATRLLNCQKLKKFGAPKDEHSEGERLYVECVNAIMGGNLPVTADPSSSPSE